MVPWYLHLRWSCYNRKHRFRLESNLNCSFRRSQQPHTDLPGDKPWPCLTTNNLITRWWSNLNTSHSPFPSPCQWQIVIRQPTSDLPTSQNCQFFKACEVFFVENPDSQFESCKLCGSETITSRAQTTETSASTNKQESSKARVTPFKFNKHVWRPYRQHRPYKQTLKTPEIPKLLTLHSA